MDRLALPTQIEFADSMEENDNIQHIKILTLWNTLLKINEQSHDDLKLQVSKGAFVFISTNPDGKQASFPTNITGEFIANHRSESIQRCFTYNSEANVIYTDSYVNQATHEYILSIPGEYPDIIFYNCKSKSYLYLHNTTSWDRHGARILTRCDEYLIEEKDVGILLKNLSVQNADNQHIASYSGLKIVNSFDLSSRCFIATCVYNSPNAKEVVILRAFRDNILRHSKLGAAIDGYYTEVSPSIVCRLRDRRYWKQIVKSLFLDPIVFIVYWVMKFHKSISKHSA